MITGVRHTGIVVKDLQGAVDFWVNLLGFQIESDQIEKGRFIDQLLGLENVEVRTIKLSSKEKTMIELLHFNSHGNLTPWTGTPYSSGITHIALNTSNIIDLVALLRSKDFHSINNIQVSPDNQVRVCYLKGFEGILLELVETIK